MKRLLKDAIISVACGILALIVLHALFYILGTAVIVLEEAP